MQLIGVFENIWAFHFRNKVTWNNVPSLLFKNVFLQILTKKIKYLKQIIRLTPEQTLI